MYERPELEEYRGDWTEAERDSAINSFRFWTWYYEGVFNALVPSNESEQKGQLEKVLRDIRRCTRKPKQIREKAVKSGT